MEVYLVGGAVRDALLGRPVTERDWVVVGATPETLLSQGYKPVGQDFPVFLHPDTAEEYALARTERKSGHGYHGFICDATPAITLEEDLLRRDLTINAMAQRPDGSIVDPYGGLADLENRVLRHVSAAFGEDPLRVLRVARFAARYAPLGFTIAPETLALMQQMTRDGEISHLTPERVWQETRKALAEDTPAVYFEALRACGALAVLFPELNALFGVPQRAEFHPEIDTGRHVMMCLEQAVRLGANPRTRFAVLLHDLGKGITPPDMLPRHIGHEHHGVPLVQALCHRYKVPKDYQQLAEIVCKHHLEAHRAVQLQGRTLWLKLRDLDALRRPERFAEFLQACEADARGRLGFEDRDYPQRAYFTQALAVAAAVGPQDLPHRETLHGKALGDALEQARIHALNRFRQEHHENSTRLCED
ncbi:tRNA nucleotidyltransferase (CCA-adding enzyme) [Fluviicoccus keumensis]|uniref:Multifunctional CCA protein n=1 Tax=Fluviicoccus keumensis TaxID=1435465 RepID=A0A4Q7YKC7_9GAMM|nr:multifunctional CCA addition/repair protein [Fluviicoccus keumensis]RZU38102.1 tRNA nucleotidyltransferase (CCA-adding enzyme) [Fluviicoccus keumensis]